MEPSLIKLWFVLDFIIFFLILPVLKEKSCIKFGAMVKEENCTCTLACPNPIGHPELWNVASGILLNITNQMYHLLFMVVCLILSGNFIVKHVLRGSRKYLHWAQSSYRAISLWTENENRQECSKGIVSCCVDIWGTWRFQLLAEGNKGKDQEENQIFQVGQSTWSMDQRDNHNWYRCRESCRASWKWWVGIAEP